MNLILLTIDCLRADHLSCLGYPRQTTPNLDRLAGEGAFFTSAISVGPHTPASFKSIFTSVYPFMNGGNLYTTDSTTTLAQVLNKHGYNTAAFHTNPWISTYYGYDQGFDTFNDSIHKWKLESRMSRPKALVERVIGKTGRLHDFLARIYSLPVYCRLYSTAGTLNRQAASWLNDNTGDFFLWVHYMDIHEPYLPASRYIAPLKTCRYIDLTEKDQKFPGSLSPKETQDLMEAYDTNLSYIDREINSLLSTIIRSDVPADTFVVITADHGQQFMERGHHGHGRYLYDELLRVPLIITGPGIQGQVISRQVSHIDLAPTILDLLKIEKPADFLGNSLLPLMNGGDGKAGDTAAISETDTVTRLVGVDSGIKLQLDANHRITSIRTGKWKYIYTEGGRDELYDLENDSKEINNIIDTELETAAELRAKIMAHIEFEEKSAPGEKELLKAKIKRLKMSGRV